MHLSSRSKVGFLVSLVVLLAIAGAFTLNAWLQPHASHAASTNSAQKEFEFNMVPSSPAIKACLPNARAEVEITRGKVNQLMEVKVKGLVPNTGFALFVIQLPHPPFGISWYQSDMETNVQGVGSASVRGIFDVETFSLSPGGPTTTFAPTHQYHLGIWFGDPQTPFDKGCEPGATKPIVTPFDGDQIAGPQVLNTSNFPDDAGPLSHVQP
jgi:hypothetical protein